MQKNSRLPLKDLSDIGMISSPEKFGQKIRSNIWSLNFYTVQGPLGFNFLLRRFQQGHPYFVIGSYKGH